MTASVERIVAMYRERKNRMGPVHAKMIELRDLYQGDVVVPLPELDKNEKPGVANLFSQGLDQMAMRVASTVPSITYPALRPGQEKSEEYARIRRLANYGWWQENRFDRKQRKRARWLLGYAAAPVMIRPDFRKQIPMWHLPDPLGTYPAPCADPDDICPPDAILAYKRSVRWLTDSYPNSSRALELGRDPSPDMEVEILEYVDADEHVLVAVGRPPETAATPWGEQRQPGLPFIELERFANRVGRCTLVYPSRPSLDRAQSQFSQMPGLYRLQARTMALWLIGTERAIFPETYLVSHPNEIADIVETADGRAGIMGRVKGGQIQEINTAPPPATGQMVDTIERNSRVTAGISPDFGGEAPTNVRTGRAGEQLLSATVDYFVQEAQETFSLSYQEENRLAVAVAREYFGDVPKSFFVNFKGSKGPVDYVPNTHFESDVNVVSWPQAGSDINSLVIGLGQRLGLGEMSIESAMEKDPYIDDPEVEKRRIATESLDKALLSAIDQQVAAGAIGPLEIARMREQVATGQMDIYKAYQAVHEQIQEQAAQAQQAPPGGPGGPGAAPGGTGAPPGAPGLMAPGVAAQLGLGAQNPPGETVAAPTPSVGHMAQLMSDLRARRAG